MPWCTNINLKILISYFQIINNMPSVSRMSEEALSKLEQAGGLKPATIAAKIREFQHFLAYWQQVFVFIFEFFVFVCVFVFAGGPGGRAGAGED